MKITIVYLLKWFLKLDQEGIYFAFDIRCVELVQFSQITIKLSKKRIAKSCISSKAYIEAYLYTYLLSGITYYWVRMTKYPEK